jgi:inosose dehydratase
VTARFRLGCAPIVWNNEDLRGAFGRAVPFEQVLDEVSAAGFEATELGDGFPRDPLALRAALQSRGLQLTSAWCGLRLIDADPSADLENTRRLCDLLANVGAPFVNLAHQGTPARAAFSGRAGEEDAPRLSDAEWDRLTERVTQCCEIARTFGLQALFHQHAGTWIETASEVEELLRRAPSPLLKLCWDVGHAIYGGIDPVQVVRKYPERIAYIHLKDVDAVVLESGRADQVDFREAIRRRVFTEVGSGCLDVPSLLQALRDIQYDGWLMVEQDSTRHTPLESARQSRAYLRSFGL